MAVFRMTHNINPNVFNMLSKKKELEVHVAVLKSASRIEGAAKKAAPVDTGTLRGNITFQIINQGFTAVIGTNKKYAPFVEFGTGGQTRIPSGFADVAAQFKGSGGFPPPRSLRGWAKRHGMKGLENAIAWGIYRNGTPAQPFLIPAYLNEVPNFEKEIERIFSTL